MPATLPYDEVETSAELEALAGLIQTSALAAVGEVARAITRLYNQVLRPSQLDVRDVGIMRVCALRRAVSVATLATELDTGQTVIRQGLKSLRQRGLIQGRSEARQTRLYRLSPRGRQKLAAAILCWDQAQQLLEMRLGPQACRDLQHLAQLLQLPHE